MLSQLPIDPVIPQIISSVIHERCVVVEAPPGAGKTTRIPAALLQALTGEIWVLEPRRIAARMAARRVAEELGQRVGETVGYQVRFEEITGPQTRLRFMTEAMLTRRLLSDPGLRGVGLVILDEFHERHIDGDLALALLRKLQLSRRPDLKLLVMSATLNAAPISAYLDNCPVVRSEGRLFPVEISYAVNTTGPLEQQVLRAVQSIIAREREGDLLVFLPGAAEIRAALHACEALGRSSNVLVLPLHGDLPPEQQDRAVLPGRQRKIILSTNVAESSITIDGVSVVIDSGLARIASDSPATGLPTLEVQRISKASAAQRAGRAGRTRQGRTIRLYSAEDFMRRREYDTPEILRRELSQVLLDLSALGIEDLPWFDPPPEEHLQTARELLGRLGALDRPKDFARFPLHPRLSRMVLEAAARGVTRDACRIAAVLSAGDRYSHTDAVHLLDGEPSGGARQIERQLFQMAPRAAQGAGGTENDLRVAILTAYPDRVARRRSETLAQLCGGKSITIPPSVRSEFFVALDIEDRRDAPAPLVRLTSEIRADWLLDLYPDRIHEREETVWNRAAERAERSSAMLYDNLIIDESRGRPSDPAAASRLLAEQAVEAGLHRFSDPGEIAALLARIEFASRHSDIPQSSMDDVFTALAGLCEGLRSFAELETAARHGLIPAIKGCLGAQGERKLNDLAPERVALKGRQVKVSYVVGQQPSIASRLQDFFGMRATPRIAGGAVPLLLHLLAPNGRPVQVTADLEGFWERLYPQVRRELSRRYPRHSWPESPLG